jgi:nicotinate-nucleotide adenylyltransferase
MGRTGVFGGTFDPPHLGHLIVAQEMYERAGLDRVLFVPAGQQPLKGAEVVAPAKVRAAMVEAAIASDERFACSLIEIERPGLSYTVETLRALGRELESGTELAFIVGADVLTEFCAWREPETLVELCTVLVAARAGSGPAGAPAAIRPKLEFVDTPLVEVTSTDVRARVRARKSIRYLVPDPVAAIIAAEGLYR